MNSRRDVAQAAAAASSPVDEAASGFCGLSADPAHAVSAWPRPVSVLTAGVCDWLHAVTVTTVGCIDIAPVLVMVVVPEGSRIRWLADLACGFAVTLLGPGQTHLAERFAARGRSLGPAQFEGLRWHVESSGAAVLDDAGPWLDCRLESVVPAAADSSSVALIGRAVAAQSSQSPGALLRQVGIYRSLPLPQPAPRAPEARHDLGGPQISLSTRNRERG